MAADWGSKFSRSKYGEIQEALDTVQFVVPMPHTSPIVMNNRAWSEIAEKQVRKAVELLQR